MWLPSLKIRLIILLALIPNNNADYEVKLLDYNPTEKFDATLALGSINFGSTDKIFAELEHAVSLCNPVQ